MPQNVCSSVRVKSVIGYEKCLQISKIEKFSVTNLKNQVIFTNLVLGCGSETQFQVGENCNEFNVST